MITVYRILREASSLLGLFSALTRGRRPNGFVGLSLIDRTVLFLVILLDKTVSDG